MFMDDAIKATLDLMHSDPEKIKVRSSYNLAGMSFSPQEITSEIKNYFPDFKITYNPDSRQAIADSWPQSIDDSVARNEWGWKPSFDLKKMSEEMIVNLKNEIVK
jgi:nucleoside-diphosphate-sugar epimerase